MAKKSSKELIIRKCVEFTPTTYHVGYWDGKSGTLYDFRSFGSRYTEEEAKEFRLELLTKYRGKFH